MNFDHSEERQMLADMLRRYLKEQYAFETRNAIAASPTGFSREQWQQFAELGVIGALFSEADGGYGGEGFDITLIFELLGHALVVEPFLSTLMSGSAIAQAGTPSQRKLIAEMIAGHKIVAFAHEEPESRFELSYVETVAQTLDNGRWRLDGVKAVVRDAEVADYFLISARSSGGVEQEQGISLFLVPANSAGISLRGYQTIDGGRAAELNLNGVLLDDSALLGPADKGYATLEQAVGRGVLALCAESVGAMDEAKEATLEYLRIRQQFGVPIGSFQALQHRMADVLMEIEQARSAVINAAAALQQSGSVREQALSAAKYTVGHIGILVSEESIQLHGGIGMTWELPLAHLAKRLVTIDHQLGDEDYHLERYVALGREVMS